MVNYKLKNYMYYVFTQGVGDVAKSQKCILVHRKLVVKKALVRTKALLAGTQINAKARFVNIII